MLRILRIIVLLGRVPIIALTAHAMNSHREQCMRAGMDGFLSKPVNFVELLRVIEQVCRQEAGPAN